MGQPIQSHFLLAALGLLAVIPSSAQTQLPAGPGKAALQKVCTACHGLEIVTQNRATRERWETVVDDMASRGAEGTDEEFSQIVEYLAEHFGPGGAGASPSSPAAAKVNVNRATAAELVKTLSISEDCAKAIVEYREKNGHFKNLESLQKVPGVDAKQLEAHKDQIEY